MASRARWHSFSTLSATMDFSPRVGWDGTEGYRFPPLLNLFDYTRPFLVASTPIDGRTREREDSCSPPPPATSQSSRSTARRVLVLDAPLAAGVHSSKGPP